MSQVGRHPWGWLSPTPGSTPKNQILCLRVLSRFSLNSIRLGAMTATLLKQLMLLKYIPRLCSCLPQGTVTHLNYANSIKMSRTGHSYVPGTNHQQTGWQKKKIFSVANLVFGSSCGHLDISFEVFITSHCRTQCTRWGRLLSSAKLPNLKTIRLCTMVWKHFKDQDSKFSMSLKFNAC